jgi:protein-tyrosine-phosphatase
MTSRQRQLLFVCAGNMCRSPMAEYLLRQHLGPKTSWRVSSAGLAAVDGAAASPPALEVLAEKGVDLAPHRSRSLTRAMVDAAELIVAMTNSQVLELTRRFPEAKGRIRLLTSFAADNHRSRAGGSAAAAGDIEDPIGGAMSTYRRIGDEIDEALLDLILYLKQRERNG